MRLFTDPKRKATPGGDGIDGIKEKSETTDTGKDTKKSTNNIDNKRVELKHDGSHDIATGKSRKETHWRNRETTWSAFVAKVSETHRTAEKFAEYKASKKTRQDEIKDVGGFVGGHVTNGRRKADNILHRQLITLDIDFAKEDIWDDLAILYGNAAVVYSTHKHSPETPRLRLIMPLDRPVRPDEYIAIARRIAESLDINAFDDTTFQPERLMYWPSTSKDGEYVFHYQDGPWLSADEILATYKNWKDASEWPVSDRVDHVINREMKKQGDPLEKPGVIGAFCRVYGIHEAIEAFLPDAYEETAHEDRYTYTKGSTSSGLVVYDDKFAYSHHGTDPVSGKTCNSFDLVRIHLFGLQDEDAKEGTPTNKLPSYTAMVKFVSEDKGTRKQLGQERLESAKADFGELFEGEEPDIDWLGEMDVDGKGKYRSSAPNLTLIMDKDPNLRGKLRLNEFEGRPIAAKDLPWRKVDSRNPYLIDDDDSGIRIYLESTYNITGVQKIKDAVAVAIRNNAFHPVRDYLNTLEWDGKSRVDSLLIDYLGAEDCSYIQTVTRKTLVAAVARVFNPGIKFDYVLVLVGKQGIGKSTIIKKLGKEWYSDSFSTVQGKEAFEQIQGVWLVEMGELAGLKKAELESTKHFISKQEDRYRVAYGRRTENFPRQCIFIGTTNDENFLRDPSGNRRFWPVNTYEQEPTKNTFVDLDSYEIDQIWAEAFTLFKNGETLYLNRELEDQAFKRQQEHREIDERAGLIERFINRPLPENWESMQTVYDRRAYWQSVDDRMTKEGTRQRDRVCAAEIWCELFGKPKSEMSGNNTRFIHAILRNLKGWVPSKSTLKSSCDEYDYQRFYVRQTRTSNSANTN